MDNKVAAVFDGKLRAYRTKPRYQYDYGLKLQISGIELPQAYEVHYSNRPSAANTITQIGDAEGAAIPDELLQTGETVYAWLYLHTGNDNSDGVTVFSIIIPVIRRAKPTNDEPTPVQQDAITEAIAALNTAVTQTAQDAADAEAAKGAAEAAAHSAQENADAASQAASDANSAGSVAAAAAAQASAAQGAAAGNAQRAETAAAAAVQAVSSAQANAANAAESAASASRHNASADDFRRQAELSAQRAAQSAETAKACCQSAIEDARTATAAAESAAGAANTAANAANSAATNANSAASAANQAAASVPQFLMDTLFDWYMEEHSGQVTPFTRIESATITGTNLTSEIVFDPDTTNYSGGAHLTGTTGMYSISHIVLANPDAKIGMVSYQKISGSGTLSVGKHNNNATIQFTLSGSELIGRLRVPIQYVRGGKTYATTYQLTITVTKAS